MGNTTSTQRSTFLQRDDRRFQELVQDRTTRPDPHGSGTDQDASQSGGQRVVRQSSPWLSEQARPRSGIYGTFRRRASNASMPDAAVTTPPIEIENEADGHEERPLVGGNSEQFRDNPETIAELSGRPLSRQPSTMSRLGSRFLPDSVVRGLLNSGEETPAEGRALRFGNAVPERSRPSVHERRLPRQINNRISLRESLRNRSFMGRSGSRRQPNRGPLTTQNGEGSLFRANDAEQSRSTVPGTASLEVPNNGSASWRRRARLSRVRESLSLQNLFGSPLERSSSTPPPRPVPGRPSRALADDSDHLLPPLPQIEHRIDVDDAPHELDAIEPEARNVLSSARTAPSTHGVRRLPHALRSRSTRLIRRGEHPPLSQVLQLAAAAIAAQLSGQPYHTANGAPSVGGEPFDGTIQNFVQTLQDAATAQAGEGADGENSDGNLPPVNFMRVFQFPNHDLGGANTDLDRSSTHDPMDLDDQQEDGNHDRSVTLVLVGVRSMPTTSEGSGDETANLGPSLDTLLSLPFLPPTNVLRNGSSGALFRRSDGRTRLNARRNSMTNFNSFPAQYESQRHQRTRSTVSRPTGDPSTMSGSTSLSTALSESPPGPHPPPSTPADLRSGTVTPNRRPSSASAVHSPMLPNLVENPEQTLDADGSAITSFTAARQRRRSDSEFARRPELSSGASRRNGVVEPDAPPVTTGRSWLIYVVGTNVSPDHPAFTMPSLFTDNPSYEDMQLLSTLLGPVKPPVATQEEVTSSGGVFRIMQHGDSMIAEPLSTAEADAERIVILGGERCLICLCDYEMAEEVRQLAKCRHVYHRECIDEWLTTGRNSCPMCRGQGVDEKSRPPGTPAQVPSAATAPSPVTPQPPSPAEVE